MGETPQECLKREIKEELELSIEVGDYLSESIYKYPNGEIKLIAYFATIVGGDMKLSVHDKVESSGFDIKISREFLKIKEYLSEYRNQCSDKSNVL